MREMKDSGVAWIGEIPKDWEIVRGKAILKQLSRPVKSDDDVITCFRDGEVTLRKNRREEGFTFSAKEIGYQGIEPNDLVIHGMDGFAGAIGISDSRGKASPVLIVCDSEQNKKYLMYYLRSLAYRDIFLALSTGIRVRSCDLRWNKLSVLEMSIPPLHEQQKIASLLDKKCTQIDTLISNQQQQIEKLKAYKQSLITEVVTKGLNPDVPMKDSGVEWIGEIPESWEINRLKYCSTFNDECLKESESPERKIKYVEIGSVSLEDGITKIETFKFKNSPSRARRITKIGDIIVSTVRTYLKAIASINEDGLIVSTGFCVIRPKESIFSKYVEYFCKSNIFSDNVSRNSYGISYPAINASTLMSFQITTPSLEEQEKIATYLDKKCSEIDSLIAIKQQKIEKLQQYKKSVIYEYVTGKKGVE